MKTLDKKIIIQLSTFFLLVLQGCSNYTDLIQSRKKSAPKTQDEAGWLVQLDVDSETKIEDFLMNHPEVQIRPIYKGVFEFFNVSKSELSESLNPKGIYKNDVFKTQSTEKISQLSNDQIITKFNTDNNFGFSKCVNTNKNAPLAEIESSQVEKFHLKTLDNKIKINLSSVQSKAKIKNLRMAWFIQAPEGSNLNGLGSKNSQLNLVPDMLGAYRVMLFVQNQQNICNSAQIVFSVTSNEPYQGGKSTKQDPLAERLDQLDKFFPHLNEINLSKAWKKSTGHGVKVAVVDSGVNYNHPQLAQQMEVNQKEIPNNNIDDDENGVVDDVLGYDFVNNDGAPFDDDGHGSHVAGLIAAKDFGVAKNATLIPIKALGTFSGDSGSLFGAIVYAVDRGANIINLSLGTYGKLHPLVLSAVKYAKEKDVLLVVAAGNGHPRTGLGLNVDEIPIYPASYEEENILTVAAHAKAELITSYSNYGKDTVDVLAPGGSQNFPMLSSYIKSPTRSSYKGLQGTSMAAPVVSGMAALVMSHKSSAHIQQIKESLIQTGKTKPGLEDFVKSGRHVDALAALDYSF